MPHKDPEANRAYFRKYLKEYRKRPGKAEANRERCRKFYSERKDYNAARIARAVERRRERKAELVKAAGGACSSCGYSENLAALDFDHMDPTTKTNTIAAMLCGGASGARLAVEVAKCRLLCANCHRAYTWSGELPAQQEYGMTGC